MCGGSYYSFHDPMKSRSHPLFDQIENHVYNNKISNSNNNNNRVKTNDPTLTFQRY